MKLPPFITIFEELGKNDMGRYSQLERKFEKQGVGGFDK